MTVTINDSNLQQEVDDRDLSDQEDLPENVAEPTICVGLCICRNNCMAQQQNELAPNEVTQNEGNEESIQREANEEFTSITPGAIDKSYDWMNQPLYTGISTTKFETYLIILHLSLRHGMTGRFILDLLKSINAIFDHTVLPESEFIFKKLFSPVSCLRFYFYCYDCEEYLGSSMK